MAQDEVKFKVSSKIGALHTKEVYDRFKSAGASSLVLSILTDGVPLYFLNMRLKKYPRGRDCNNQSAKAQSDFVSETLKDWEARGYVKRVPLDKARTVLPLSVAHRWSHTKKKLKYRLVLVSVNQIIRVVFHYYRQDCSPLTKNMAYGKIKLPDLNYLRHQIQQGDLIGLIDITSFYLHFTLDSKIFVIIQFVTSLNLTNYFI